MPPERQLDPPSLQQQSPQPDTPSSTTPASPSMEGPPAGTAPATGGTDAGCFDCNICLELAQDPVVTLCGHLFCWPCLYRWLHGHSTCQECPVCKAAVEEDKVVPLYGRGSVGSVDPRKKAVPPADSIPHRPAGPRPETARPAENQFQQPGFAFSAGPAPMATARFGNFTFSAGFGLFPSLFGFQMHGIPDNTGFGPGYPFGFPMGMHGAQAYVPPYAAAATPDQQEAKLSRLLMCLGFLVLLYILLF